MNKLWQYIKRFVVLTRFIRHLHLLLLSSNKKLFIASSKPYKFDLALQEESCEIHYEMDLSSLSHSTHLIAFSYLV